MVLLVFVGARIFSSARWGLVAAALFALSPIIWRQAVIAPAMLYPLPLVMGWLLAATYARSADARWWAVAAGACLGAGVYTSNASAVMMPVYLGLTVAVLGLTQAAPWRQLGVCVAVFAVIAAPFAGSWLAHPADLRLTITAHHLYDAQRFNVLQGGREMTSWVGLTARSEVYWDYFNPAFLFLGPGVLFPLLIVLVPAGLLRILASDRTPVDLLLLMGAALAPVAASLSAEAPTPGRILFLTPFAALIAVHGAQYLLSFRSASR